MSSAGRAKDNPKTKATANTTRQRNSFICAPEFNINVASAVRRLRHDDWESDSLGELVGSFLGQDLGRCL